MQTELQLLQQIAENTSSSSSLQIAWVAGGSAVAGALSSALLSYLGIRGAAKSQAKIEQKKLHATIISAERLRWLQDIRARLSEVYANMDTQFSLLQRPVSAPAAAERQKELDDLSSEIMKQSNIIYLMLNPDKAAQKKLRDSLQNCQKFLVAHFNEMEQARSDSSTVAYREIKQAAFDALTTIGTETWDQVKGLE